MPIFDFTETLNDYSDSEISENSKYEFLLGIGCGFETKEEL